MGALRQKKSKRRECSYGEKCYRKAPAHFEQFGHPHLESLLEMIGDGEVRVPDFYSPKISCETLVEQLNIEKRANPKFKTKPNSDNGSSTPVSRKAEGRSTASSSIGRTSESDDSPTSRSQQMYQESGDVLRKFSEERTWRRQEKEKEERCKNSSGGSSSGSSSSSGGGGSGSGSSSGSSSACSSEENRKQADSYRIVVWDRTKVKVSEKLKQASPYNFFLTTITDSKPTHSEMLSICLPELLDPTLGDLESSLQVNFMVEFGWLLAQYHVMGHRCKPLTLIYGEVDMDLGDKFKHFLTHVKVKPPSTFGSHHTKMMIFSYKDGSLRIVVSTANLVESDWDNRTQGLWISDSCPKLSDTSDTGGGDSRTFFKRDFLRYLSAYQLAELSPWIGRVQRADMSKINVFFISSVPGSHTTYRNQWGQLALRKALNDNVVVPDRNSYQVIVQCSSIGSMGPGPDSWLMGDILTTFCSGKKMALVSRPQLKFIYPSFENVAGSYDGLLGGGCLPYSKKTHSKQEWLTAFMCQWKSDKRERSRAPPHIKSYCRVSADLSRLSYFLLTSANMSKAAWGNINKNGSLNILSYEAGVLFLPQFIIGEEFFPLKDIDGISAPIFPIPYDLPVTPYSASDVPWVFEYLT